MEYENRKTRFYSVLNENSDGNIVRIQELFRADSHYYIVMPRIEKEIPLSEIVRNYSFEDRVLLCRIVAHSMMHIHKAHIVHADIKDTNVLVHESAGGKLSGKSLILTAVFLKMRYLNRKRIWEEIRSICHRKRVCFCVVRA